jgi:sigma-B regulation protein RsbU (phosphoserine phosphatase)
MERAALFDRLIQFINIFNPENDFPISTVEAKYHLKELQVNALLEITQAINNNLPASSLYKIYEFTLRANLNIKQLALFVMDESWHCVVDVGTEHGCGQDEPPEDFLALSEVTRIDSKRKDVFNEFSYVIPVRHKDKILAVAFVGGLEKRQDDSTVASNLRFIQTLSNIILVAIENKKLARQQLEQESLRKELEIASDVQHFLFPEKLPYGPRLKVEASYLPHDRIGGDYYDYIPLNKNQFLLCIADVSGKGIPAALLMSNFQASLRTMVRQTGNLREIVEELNYQVLENAKGEKFITFFVCIYDHSLKTMAYINAGHNPPLLITEEEGHWLSDGSTVLGAVHPMPFINEGFITDLEDFVLFCYTDGLTETLNEQEEEFGESRLQAFFASHETRDLRMIHQDIIIALDEFKGRNNYRDDITILTCKINP